MTTPPSTDLTPQILRFYARCLLYPYEEMIYELQYMFRDLETRIDNDDDMIAAHEMLAVLNAFQGEDIQDLRADFVFLFANRDRADTVCPMLAGEFTTRFNLSYDSGSFIDLLHDSDFVPGDEDTIDSVVNYLEFCAFLYDVRKVEFETSIEPGRFLASHVLPWVPKFCEILYTSANISFYRELAASLQRYLRSATGNEFHG